MNSDTSLSLSPQKAVDNAVVKSKIEAKGSNGHRKVSFASGMELISYINQLPLQEANDYVHGVQTIAVTSTSSGGLKKMEVQPKSDASFDTDTATDVKYKEIKGFSNYSEDLKKKLIRMRLDIKEQGLEEDKVTSDTGSSKIFVFFDIVANQIDMDSKWLENKLYEQWQMFPDKNVKQHSKIIEIDPCTFETISNFMERLKKSHPMDNNKEPKKLGAVDLPSTKSEEKYSNKTVFPINIDELPLFLSRTVLQFLANAWDVRFLNFSPEFPVEYIPPDIVSTETKLVRLANDGEGNWFGLVKKKTEIAASKPSGNTGNVKSRYLATSSSENDPLQTFPVKPTRILEKDNTKFSTPPQRNKQKKEVSMLQSVLQLLNVGVDRYNDYKGISNTQNPSKMEVSMVKDYSIKYTVGRVIYEIVARQIKGMDADGLIDLIRDRWQKNRGMIFNEYPEEYHQIKSYMTKIDLLATEESNFYCFDDLLMFFADTWNVIFVVYQLDQPIRYIDPIESNRGIPRIYLMKTESKWYRLKAKGKFDTDENVHCFQCYSYFLDDHFKKNARVPETLSDEMPDKMPDKMGSSFNKSGGNLLQPVAEEIAEEIAEEAAEEPAIAFDEAVTIESGSKRSRNKLNGKSCNRKSKSEHTVQSKTTMGAVGGNNLGVSVRSRHSVESNKKDKSLQSLQSLQQESGISVLTAKDQNGKRGEFVKLERMIKHRNYSRAYEYLHYFIDNNRIHGMTWTFNEIKVFVDAIQPKVMNHARGHQKGLTLLFPQFSVIFWKQIKRNMIASLEGFDFHRATKIIENMMMHLDQVGCNRPHGNLDGISQLLPYLEYFPFEMISCLAKVVAPIKTSKILRNNRVELGAQQSESVPFKYGGYFLEPVNSCPDMKKRILDELLGVLAVRAYADSNSWVVNEMYSCAEVLLTVLNSKNTKCLYVDEQEMKEKINFLKELKIKLELCSDNNMNLLIVSEEIQKEKERIRTKKNKLKTDAGKVIKNIEKKIEEVSLQATFTGGDHDVAATACSEEQPVNIYNNAFKLFQQGQVDRAIALYKEICVNFPHSSYCLLAQIALVEVSVRFAGYEEVCKRIDTVFCKAKWIHSDYARGVKKGGYIATTLEDLETLIRNLNQLVIDIEERVLTVFSSQQSIIDKLTQQIYSDVEDKITDLPTASLQFHIEMIHTEQEKIRGLDQSLKQAHQLARNAIQERKAWLAKNRSRKHSDHRHGKAGINPGLNRDSEKKTVSLESLLALLADSEQRLLGINLQMNAAKALGESLHEGTSAEVI